MDSFQFHVYRRCRADDPDDPGYHRAQRHPGHRIRWPEGDAGRKLTRRGTTDHDRLEWVARGLTAANHRIRARMLIQGSQRRSNVQTRTEVPGKRAPGLIGTIALAVALMG